MTKWIKVPLLGIAIILVIVGGLALYIQMSGIPHYDVKPVNLQVDVTPARIERGKAIATMLCQGCHYDQATHAFTGHKLTDIPPAFGTIYSRNITQDKKYGIGNWTDGQIAYLLRTGVKPDGSYVPPYMVKLPHMSDEDLFSIIAFLRSSDTLVRPMAVQDSDCRPSFLVKLLSHFAFKPFAYPEHAQVAPPKTDAVAYGKYLVNDVAMCYSCHSADFKTNNEEQPALSKGYLGGGNAMLDANGMTIYSTNLTMDNETGLGKWSETEFSRAVRDGFAPGNVPIRYPMERHPQLSEQDVASIFAYLKTVPVIHSSHKTAQVLHASTTSTAGMDAAALAGQQVYYKYACWSCHGKTGVGTCDLTGADKKYANDSAMSAWIHNPSATLPTTTMPNWAGVIPESDFQPLCEYVRYLCRKR